MFFTLLFSALTAQAQAPLTIERLENHKHTALITASDARGSVKVGDEYYVETPIGNCFIQVTEVYARQFRANTEQCRSEHLAQGTAVYPKEKVVIERQNVSQVQTIETLPEDRITFQMDFISPEFYDTYLKNRLSVNVAYLTGKTLSGTANLDNTTTIGDFKTSNTIALGADYRILTLPRNFSWSAGFEYNLPRSIGNYTLTTTNGSTTQRFGNDPSLEVFNMFTNIRYQFNEKLFAQVGLNYLFADLSDAPGEASGDYGVHLGARYYAIKNLFVDGQINFYNIDYKVAGRTADFSLTELALKAGYTF